MEYAAKMCRICGDYKPLDSFSKCKKARDGLQSYCKDCFSWYSKTYYKSNFREIKIKQRLYKHKTQKERNIYLRNWRIKNPASINAHGKLNYAVKKGIVIKPKNCSICGVEKKLHAHHEDYNYPYSVQWLCVECHRNLNKEKRNVAAN